MKNLEKNTNTWKNLEIAFAGESQACVKYQYYASKAKKDGFEQISAIFDETSHNEKEHETRYLKLSQNVTDDIVFKSDKVTIWKCRNCGYIHTGDKAPETCPVCAHPQSYFEIRAENY